ncbi:hypothetical protein [Oxynema aestuarii]|uniref:Uncharacterized protein n=1 Tax=Oxynema aestuarii AP17 TaxID=2064643 RepID=A0A6H1U5D1_9CYAN|nr:hypothetical protein [Oxynema aestuarii]QIZ73360.1 hypothetical protein HCG48_24440 [Oxynema aestuarii AP17]
MSEDKKVMNELKNDIYTQISSKYNKCLWPKSDCTNDCIKAHSIQNSQILDQLASNNHVVMPVARLNLDTGPEIEFKKVGRNKATTFTGLCSEHDRQLFRPIDVNKFDSSNEEQKFLIAYRSVLRELHTRIKAAIDLQTTYQKSVKLGKCDPNNRDISLFVTCRIVNAIDFCLYKKMYDNIYNSNSFTEVQHDYICIEKSCPLAVSSLFNPINSSAQNKRPEPKFIVLNVFPHNKNTIVLLSYLSHHQKELSSYANEIINANGDDRLYLLSKTILRYCENFVISPEQFESFSPPKVDAIKKFYGETAKRSDYDDDNENLMLF